MLSITTPAPQGVRWMVGYDVTDATPTAERPPHRGLPSGSLTLVFSTGAPLLCSSSFGDWAQARGRSHDVCVGGFHLRPVYLQRPDHQEGIQVAVHPLAARRLLGLPAAALTELTQEGEDVVGARMREVFTRVASADPGERAGLVADGLSTLAGQNEDRRAPRREVVAAWTLLERSRGRSRVAEIAAEIGVSTRHLSSLVRAELGIGTKQLADLLRFEAAHSALVADLAAGRNPHLADLAHAHGYADHAHLDRDYRRFADSSPSGWMADEYLLSPDRPAPVPKDPSRGRCPGERLRT